ncbi:unnamed protein product, partial [Prorocentrum cordatum]
ASRDFLMAQLDLKLATLRTEVIAESGALLEGPIGAAVVQQQRMNKQFTGQIQASTPPLRSSNPIAQSSAPKFRKCDSGSTRRKPRSPTEDYASLIEWDRPADASIVVGTATDIFTAEHFKLSIQPITDKCEFVDGAWEVVGNSPPRRFVIQFSGDASARKVRSFYGARKGPEGAWLNTEVLSVHGNATRLFLGLDRSGKTARGEVQSKKDDATRLLFKCDGRLVHGANREDIREQFEQVFHASLEAKNVQWRTEQDLGSLARAKSAGAISVTKWRARALLCQDPIKREQKVAHMLRALNSSAELAWQDVQGSEAELAREIHSGLHIKSAQSPNADGELPNTLVIRNARRFELSEDQVRRAVGPIRAELSIAEQRPERAAALVTGDFNFMDDAPLELTAPPVNQRRPRRRNHHPERKRLWGQALDTTVEVDPAAPTRYAEHSQQRARIGQIYTSSPTWVLIQWHAK